MGIKYPESHESREAEVSFLGQGSNMVEKGKHHKKADKSVESVVYFEMHICC